MNSDWESKEIDSVSNLLLFQQYLDLVLLNLIQFRLHSILSIFNNELFLWFALLITMSFCLWPYSAFILLGRRLFINKNYNRSISEIRLKELYIEKKYQNSFYILYGAFMELYLSVISVKL